MKRYVVPLIMLVLLILSVSIVYAQANEPVELQPSFILMDGEEKIGAVWSLDGGWVVDTDSTSFYTCGCMSDVCTYEPEYVPPTDPPDDDPTPVPPTPTDEPTPPPTEPPSDDEKCNRGIGNGSENCDPGNSSGQGKGQGRKAGEDRNEP